MPTNAAKPTVEQREWLGAFRVSDFVQRTLHHCQITLGRQKAGLDVSLFADQIETKFVSETLGELAHELALRGHCLP